ncbi:hypothetical protein KC19_VG205200 [Ceratodon purpureus]|uniref:Secreted protein n=1 Tax=Ceratodon purpureus TaxID=3225 RepID=A0A8T0HTA6_CERPU|nr:hypothetical protein KC19_VG205200 [Ceratodon purpureus]
MSWFLLVDLVWNLRLWSPLPTSAFMVHSGQHSWRTFFGPKEALLKHDCRVWIQEQTLKMYIL